MDSNLQEQKSNKRIFSIGGMILIICGVLILLGQLLKINWLTLLALPISGAFLILEGFQKRFLNLCMIGGMIFCLGMGVLIGFGPILSQTLNLFQSLGVLLLAFGAGWCGITVSTYFFDQKPAWWALIPGSISWGTGLSFLSLTMSWNYFILYIGLSLGTAFLLWGIARRLLGLIIAGSLVGSMALGVHLGWGDSLEILSPLTSTGTMLVVFAMGWGLITVLSRAIAPGFVWWPLIPSGILAIVGYGLYIGGNPNEAANFIGNTGSIGLILLGLYLLMMRRENQS